MAGRTVRRLAVVSFAVLTAAISINALYLQKQPAVRGAAEPEVIRTRLGNDRTPGAGPDGKPSPTGRAAGFPRIEPADTSLPGSSAPQQIIRGVQRELALRGYKVGADDGRLRILTREAIIAYQFDRDLPLTGEPSEHLLKDLLFAPIAASGSRDGQVRPFEANERLVRAVQDILAGLGYGPGAISGGMTAQTRDALRQFQTDRNIAATGALSERLLLELIHVTGKPIVYQSGGA